MLLGYQTGGQTSTGALPADPRQRWRCLFIDEIDQVLADMNRRHGEPPTTTTPPTPSPPSTRSPSPSGDPLLGQLGNTRPGRKPPLNGLYVLVTA